MILFQVFSRVLILDLQLKKFTIFLYLISINSEHLMCMCMMHYLKKLFLFPFSIKESHHFVLKLLNHISRDKSEHIIEKEETVAVLV